MKHFHREVPIIKGVRAIRFCGFRGAELRFTRSGHGVVLEVRHVRPGKRQERPGKSVARERKGILDRWNRYRQRHGVFRGIDGATNDFLKELKAGGVHLTRGTLYNWDQAYRCNGLVGLEDRRGNKRRVGSKRYRVRVG